MPDVKITLAIRSGDHTAFHSFYTVYFTRMVQFAYSYVRDSFTAESIVQDAFMKLWEKREQLPGDTNLPAYVLTIVKNETLNYLKRAANRQMMEKELLYDAQQEINYRIRSLESSRPENLFNKDIQQLIRKAMEELPARTKEVFVLSRMEYQSHKQIATSLNITTKAVEFHVTKALKVLRKHLGDYLETVLLITSLFFFEK